MKLENRELSVGARQSEADNELAFELLTEGRNGNTEAKRLCRLRR